MPTFSTNLRLGTPSVGDTSYTTTVQNSFGVIDGQAPLNGLYVRTHEAPSSSLMIDVIAGQIVDQAGAVQTITGVSGHTLAASTTYTIYLDGTASWAITYGTSYPTTPHVRLATVVVGSSTVTSVTDNRETPRIAGQMIPQVVHLLSTATAAPTIAAGAAAGTSPTVSVTGTDLDGVISITTGTGPGTGTLATITFNVAFGAAPNAILLFPANANAAGVAADVFANAANITTAHFTADAATALTASTPYKWFYAVLG